jgi:hypothetical protein
MHKAGQFRLSPGGIDIHTSERPFIDKPEPAEQFPYIYRLTITGTNNGKKSKHAFMGISWPDEYRDQKGRPDTVLVQPCVYTVLHPAVILSERLVVAGHDDLDYPVVLVIVAVGRQTLDMELDTIISHRMCTA